MDKYNLLFILGIKAQQTQWITDSAGIWKISFDGYYSEIDKDLTSALTTADYKSIIDVLSDNVSLVHVTSYTNTISGRALAMATEPCWIFDTETDTLYIRLFNYDDPRVHTILLSVGMTISRRSFDDTENDVLYREDLLQIPDLSEKKDSQYSQSISFNSFTTSINNAGRRYDFLIGKNLIGQKGIYYWGKDGDPFSKYKSVLQARAEEIEISDNVSISFVDQRKQLSRSLPMHFFTTAEYPNIKAEYVGKPKPMIYGFQLNHVCIPLDDNITQTNYTFMVADTTWHDIYDFGLIADPLIYVDTVNQTANIINWDETAGTFQIPAAYYTPGQVVTFSGFGYVFDASPAFAIFNPIDIWTDLMQNCIGISYNDTNYNTEECEEVSALLSQASINISEPEEMVDIMKRIAEGCSIALILDRDGRYTARKFDPDSIPVLTIAENMWYGKPVYKSSAKKVFSSVSVNFLKSIVNGKASVYNNTDYEDEVHSEYDIYKNEEFDCIYVLPSSAQQFSEDIMLQAKNKVEYIYGSVKDPYINLEVVKTWRNAQVEFNRQIGPYEYSEFIGKVKCEIIEVNPDLENRKVDLVFRIIKRIEKFENIYDYDFNGDESTDIYDFNGGENTDIIDFNRS